MCGSDGLSSSSSLLICGKSCRCQAENPLNALPSFTRPALIVPLRHNLATSAALADANHAIGDARKIGHAATLMVALGYALPTYIYRGDYEAANAQADELVALADEKGAMLWKAAGMLNQGWISALTDNASNAVHMITSGLAAWRSTGATLWAPSYLPFLARAHAELRQFDDAWRCVGEAMAAM